MIFTVIGLLIKIGLLSLNNSTLFIPKIVLMIRMDFCICLDKMQCHFMVLKHGM